jgi:hypothetical protein
MGKKDFSKGLIVGIIIGALVTFGILWYWDTYHRKSKMERNVEKFEKNAKKELKKLLE